MTLLITNKIIEVKDRWSSIQNKTVLSLNMGERVTCTIYYFHVIYNIFISKVRPKESEAENKEIHA